MHPMFHVSCLKKAKGEQNEAIKLPAETKVDPAIDYELGQIVARRYERANEHVQQFLVKWKGRTVEKATWEDADMMATQFPTFSLEDKAGWEGRLLIGLEMKWAVKILISPLLETFILEE